MKLIIVGTGWIAESFKKACDIAGEIECVGVYSRTYESAKAFCDKTGIKRIFTDLKEAAEFDGAEAVYIASPNSCHYYQSKLMLESGKNVLCEKPITVDLKEFEELSNFAKSKKLIYLQALMMLYSPNFFALEEAVKSVGKITSVHLDFSQLSSRYQAYLDGKNPNVFSPEMQGGSLNDLGIYIVSLALRLFGKPGKLFSSSRFLENGVDSSGVAVLGYDDFDVTLTYSKTGQSRAASQIIGDRKTLTIGSVSKLCDIWLVDESGEKTCIVEDITQETAMSYEAESFKKAVEKNLLSDEFFEMCFSISRDSLEMIEKIKKA